MRHRDVSTLSPRVPVGGRAVRRVVETEHAGGVVIPETQSLSRRTAPPFDAIWMRLEEIASVVLRGGSSIATVHSQAKPPRTVRTRTPGTRTCGRQYSRAGALRQTVSQKSQLRTHSPAVARQSTREMAARMLKGRRFVSGGRCTRLIAPGPDRRENGGDGRTQATAESRGRRRTAQCRRMGVKQRHHHAPSGAPHAQDQRYGREDVEDPPLHVQGPPDQIRGDDGTTFRAAVRAGAQVVAAGEAQARRGFDFWRLCRYQRPAAQVAGATPRRTANEPETEP